MPTKRFLVKVIIGVVVFIKIAMIGVFIFHEFFNFTSSNSAIYILRGEKGGIELSRDLFFESADRLIFMLDVNCIFDYFMKGLAVAKGKPLLELTWDK